MRATNLLRRITKPETAGKVPEDKEAMMTHKLVVAIDQHGMMRGMREFMKSSENVMWINARFMGDKEAYHEWMAHVRSRVEIEQASRKLQDDTFSDAPSSSGPLAETAPTDQKPGTSPHAPVLSPVK